MGRWHARVVVDWASRKLLQGRALVTGGEERRAEARPPPSYQAQAVAALKGSLVHAQDRPGQSGTQPTRPVPSVHP